MQPQPPRDATREGPYKSVCTNSSFLGLKVLPTFKKLSFFCFPRILLSQMSRSTFFLTLAAFPSTEVSSSPFDLYGRVYSTKLCLIFCFNRGNNVYKSCGHIQGVDFLFMSQNHCSLRYFPHTSRKKD